MKCHRPAGDTGGQDITSGVPGECQRHHRPGRTTCQAPGAPITGRRQDRRHGNRPGGDSTDTGTWCHGCSAVNVMLPGRPLAPVFEPVGAVLNQHG